MSWHKGKVVGLGRERELEYNVRSRTHQPATREPPVNIVTNTTTQEVTMVNLGPTGVYIEVHM